MSNKKTSLNRWDKLMMAITFAEAGEHETAKEFLDNTKKIEKRPEKQEANRPDLRV